MPGTFLCVHVSACQSERTHHDCPHKMRCAQRFDRPCLAQLSRESRHAECHYPTVVRHQRMRVLHFGHRRPQIRACQGWTAGPCLPLADVCNRACSPYPYRAFVQCAQAYLCQSCKHERGQSREHVSVCRNVLATQPNHSLAIVTGSPSGTTSSSGNIMPNIAACPLVCLSGRITQPWHARERSCVGAPACASTHASARAVTHSQRLFHTRIQPSHRCTSVAPGLVHPPPRQISCTHCAVRVHVH